MDVNFANRLLPVSKHRFEPQLENVTVGLDSIRSRPRLLVTGKVFTILSKVHIKKSQSRVHSFVLALPYILKTNQLLERWLSCYRKNATPKMFRSFQRADDYNF